MGASLAYYALFSLAPARGRRRGKDNCHGNHNAGTLGHGNRRNHCQFRRSESWCNGRVRRITYIDEQCSNPSTNAAHTEIRMKTSRCWLRSLSLEEEGWGYSRPEGAASSRKGRRSILQAVGKTRTRPAGRARWTRCPGVGEEH